MAQLNTLQNIYKERGSEFINKLFDSHVIISEQIDGSRFIFQKHLDNTITFYKKDNEQISFIDRTIMRFYETAIKYIENLPTDTKVSLPDNWAFGFKYFPSLAPINISYDRMPLNNLILTDISIRNDQGKIIKVIHDPRILNEWSQKLSVEKPPIIFNDKLTDFQKVQLNKYLETPEANLIEIFKTDSFTHYIISILNPKLRSSALMNDLQKPIEGIIFKFIEPGSTSIVSAKIIDPIFYQNGKTVQPKERTSSDIYQIVILDLIEFIEQYDLSKILLTTGTADERYVELISSLFNNYVAASGHKYFGINFDLPDFAKKSEFDVNQDNIRDARTRELIANDHLRNLYKIMLSSFRKYRKNPTDILTQDIIDTLNNIIKNIEDLTFSKNTSGTALDFKSFINANKLSKNESIFEQEIFEALSLSNKRQGHKKVNIFIGRFQPFTLGHAKVFETLHRENGLPVVVFLVRGSKRDYERAPFDEDMQLRMFAAMQKEYKFLEAAYVISNASIDQVLNSLRPTYEPVLWGTGTDRLSSYRRMVDRYREEAHLLPEMQMYEIKRGDEDISATKVRNALSINDIKTFNKMVPNSLHKFFKELSGIIDQVKIKESEMLSFKQYVNVINEAKSQELKFKASDFVKLEKYEHTADPGTFDKLKELCKKNLGNDYVVLFAEGDDDTNEILEVISKEHSTSKKLGEDEFGIYKLHNYKGIKYVELNDTDAHISMFAMTKADTKKFEKLDTEVKESVNEAREVYKRQYTDNHPAKVVNSESKIRNKILEAIADKQLTKEELNVILAELNANGRWFSRNSHLFKVNEEGKLHLSKIGSKIHSRIKVIKEESNFQLNPGMNILGMGPVKFPGAPGTSAQFHLQDPGSGDIMAGSYIIDTKKDDEEKEKKRLVKLKKAEEELRKD